MKKTLLSIFLVLTFLCPGISFGAVGGGDIVFKSEKAKDVTFSHDFHVTKQKLTCQKCHPGIYAMSKSKNKPVTMAEINQGKSCGTCHNGKEAFVPQGNCAKCHK
jgi:c(7)-type cytochrome triheme protein